MIRHCIALVVCVLSLSQVFGGLPTSWPHERSDISPDPEITWATLPNGLRYALRPNAEPPGRISLRFLVHVGSLYEQLNSNTGGPIFSLAPRVMTGGDTRFGVPNYSILYSRTLEELREWVEPAFRHGPIEVSIVGDVDFQTATEAISNTIGALPTREECDHREADLVAIPRADKNTSVSSIDAKLGQVGVAYYWPVHEIEDMRKERRFGLFFWGRASSKIGSTSECARSLAPLIL